MTAHSPEFELWVAGPWIRRHLFLPPPHHVTRSSQHRPAPTDTARPATFVHTIHRRSRGWGSQTASTTARRPQPRRCRRRCWCARCLRNAVTSRRENTRRRDALNGERRRADFGRLFPSGVGGTMPLQGRPGADQPPAAGWTLQSEPVTVEPRAPLAVRAAGIIKHLNRSDRNVRMVQSCDVSIC